MELLHVRKVSSFVLYFKIKKAVLKIEIVVVIICENILANPRITTLKSNESKYFYFSRSRKGKKHWV